MIKTRKFIQKLALLRISVSKIDIISFLKISFWDQAKMPKQKAKSNKDVYEKVEDLPEVRQKNYFSILEDFDKQGMYLNQI